MVFITKSYQDLFGVRSYINAIIYYPYVSGVVSPWDFLFLYILSH